MPDNGELTAEEIGQPELAPTRPLVQSAYDAAPPGLAFAPAATINPEAVPGAINPFAPPPGPVPGAPIPAAPPPLAATPPPLAPVVPIRRPKAAGAPGAPPGGGIPGELTDLDTSIAANTEAQQTAATNAGDIESAGLARQASAKAEQADTARQQAADLAAQQVYVRDRQAELNAQDTANLEIAKNKTIPNFWEGREGAHVGASIGVVLAGLGAGLLGSNVNQASQVIQHNIDGYFDRQKEQTDNLFKYASQQGLVNDKARDQYAKSLVDMLQQHAAVLDAAKERVDQVALESQSDEAKARAATLSTQLGAAATKEHLQVTDARIKAFDASETAKTKMISARADMIRSQAYAAHERAAAKAGGGDEKQDEAAFRTYVAGPHGKEAQEIGRRVAALRSAAADVENAKSVGEVTAQIDKAIAADAGQGTRGVSMGQLHTILPNLVSASGEISNKVSQNWDGTAGREFRAAAKRMIGIPLEGRTAEYKSRADDLEKALALTPHALKNPNFAKVSRSQLYPDLAAPAAPAASSSGGTAEGSTATSGGKPIIFRGGKWVPNG